MRVALISAASLILRFSINLKLLASNLSNLRFSINLKLLTFNLSEVILKRLIIFKNDLLRVLIGIHSLLLPVYTLLLHVYIPFLLDRYRLIT